ncbi:hypothetical protein WMY93_024159 [Mugilogobius chulae]|uniref:Gypsy retrotransposon integrase-like protein 1 n=1 Tax=Mugilogobius chulae TaxID=88201 RepID=A0AAW0NAS5_9GOBI
MNIISHCFEEAKKHIDSISTDKVQQTAWAAAFKVCAKRASFSAPDGSIGHVRPISRHPILVPARSDVLVWGRTKPGVNDQDYQCLVEPVEVGDLFVARTLCTVKNGRVLLRVRNVNDSPTYIYRHQKLAKTFTIDSADIIPENDVTMTRVSVNAVRVSTGPVKPQPEQCVLPDLTNIDLPAEQKQRLHDLLYRHRAVFAQHDEDYGLTSTMQHEIPTGLAPPVRERYRQIPPKMYQEVKGLIQDALSRFPPGPAGDAMDEGDGVEIPSFRHVGAYVARAMCGTSKEVGQPSHPQPLPGISLYPERTETQWAVLQNDDVTLRKVVQYIQRQCKPNKQERRRELKSVLTILKHWDRLFLIDGVLHRKRWDPKEVDPVLQLLVPEGEQYNIFKLYHDRAGHWGPEKTMSLIQRRFYWPRLSESIVNWCAQCQNCVLRKTATTAAPLVTIKTSAPMELVSADFLSIGHPEDPFHNVLVMVDHFTKFAWATATKDQTALTTAKVIWSQVIQPFGVPKRIMSDQGPNFESQLVRELCELYGIQKDHTTPYHPAGNGSCERLNRTLLGLLGTLGEERRNWRDHLPEMMQVYNNTTHSSTGYSPHYLMFGRHGFLPQDRILGLTDTVACSSVDGWVKCHQRRLQYAFTKASQHRDSEMTRQKRHYDRKAQDSPLAPGDRVLLQDTRAKCRSKLADKWEPQPYIVVKQPNLELPVYVIRQESSNKEKVVHRNLLQLCPFLPTQAPALNTRLSNSPQNVPAEAPIQAWMGFCTDPVSTPALQNIPDPGGAAVASARDGDPEPRRSTRSTKGLPPRRLRDL